MMTENSAKKKTRSRASHTTARPLNLKLWQDNHQVEVQINIVPLIDVIFCILTFFILGAVGLSRQQAISLDLPKAKTGVQQMREMMLVSLDDVGQIYVDKQLVTQNQLYEAIKNYHQFNPTGLMVLHASRNASYNDVVQVLDMLRDVGGNRVALATLPGESTPVEPTSPGSNLNLPSGTNVPGNSLNYGQPQIPNQSNPAVNGSQFNQGNSGVPNVPGVPNTTAPMTTNR